MEYKNESKTILGGLAAAGLVGGSLTSIIATVVYANALSGYATGPGDLAAASAWQTVGNGAISLGLLSLIAYLVSHSFAYDLKFRIRENREQSETAASPEHEQ